MDPSAPLHPPAADRVYLDHASAVPWHPAALAAADQVARSLPGDPARSHGAGRAARDLLESARVAVAATLGAAPERLVFTSGGTEAVHLAVRGAVAARARPGRRVVVASSAVEHSAVLAAADAATGAGGASEHVRVDVDRRGRVRLDRLADVLAGGDVAVVSLQHANHEVGTLQPVAEAAALCREHGALLAGDACQTAGRVPTDLDALGADLLALSGAKFGGGRGVGALAWSPRARLRPLLGGDEREHRRRAGLEHLPGIAAMAETLLRLDPRAPDGAAAIEAARCDALRRRLRARLPEAVPDLEVHGSGDDAAPHILAVSALYVDGETLVTELDRAGFEVHSGSSCASTSGQPSHVLVAMGALTHGHVRVSLGPGVDEAAVDWFVDAFAHVVATLRARVGR